MHLKKIQIGEFLHSRFNIKDGKNKQHFQHIMLYYFKKGENATETQKNICAVYGKGAATDQTCQSGLQSFMLEMSRWMMLHSWVGQLKLTAIKSRHQELSILYHMGDSQHTQNIQINKVIGENEKCVFYSTEKLNGLLATPIVSSGPALQPALWSTLIPPPRIFLL